MIQDEYTGLIYEPSSIKKQSKKILMKKLKSKFNQLKSIIKEAVKKQPLVDQEIDNIEVTAGVLYTNNHLEVRCKLLEKEVDYWQKKHFNLAYHLSEKERINKAIKSLI